MKKIETEYLFLKQLSKSSRVQAMAKINLMSNRRRVTGENTKSFQCIDAYVVDAFVANAKAIDN